MQKIRSKHIKREYIANIIMLVGVALFFALIIGVQIGFHSIDQAKRERAFRDSHLDSCVEAAAINGKEKNYRTWCQCQLTILENHYGIAKLMRPEYEANESDDPTLYTLTIFREVQDTCTNGLRPGDIDKQTIILKE